MKFYWAARTRASRVAWMLEELGEPFERVTVDIGSAGAKADPEFRAASPMAKVPALIDGEVKMSDSAAICLYLADRYAAGQLAPALDAPTRGAFLYWMMFTPGVIEPAMAEKVGGHEANPRSHGWGDFPTMVKTLEDGLARGPWILGDTFSAADVMLGSSCVFLRLFNLLPDSKALNAYADRSLERPAYQRALALEGDS